MNVRARQHLKQATIKIKPAAFTNLSCGLQSKQQKHQGEELSFSGNGRWKGSYLSQLVLSTVGRLANGSNREL